MSGLLTTSGAIALSQINYEKSVCGDNFWCVTNGVHDSRSETRTWQVINALSWQLTDSIKLKNILSYAEFQGDQSLDLFGLVLPVNGATTIGAAANSFQLRQNLAQTRALPGGNGGTNAESSFVYEMQLQGKGDRFNWQGGFYLETSKPLRYSGTIGRDADAMRRLHRDTHVRCDRGRSGNAVLARSDWQFARADWLFATANHFPGQGDLFPGHL